MTEGAAARPIEGKVGVVPGTRRINGVPGITAAAAALATAGAVAGDEPNGAADPRKEKTGTGVGGVAVQATPEAEVEATVDEGVVQGVQSARVGEKIGAGAEVGGADTALKAQGRVRGPVAKTETDET